MTTQSEIRQAFWAAHQEHERRFWQSHLGHNDYPADVRSAFVDYIDGLQKDGRISSDLANRVTLGTRRVRKNRRLGPSIKQALELFVAAYQKDDQIRIGCSDRDSIDAAYKTALTALGITHNERMTDAEPVKPVTKNGDYRVWACDQSRGKDFILRQNLTKDDAMDLMNKETEAGRDVWIFTPAGLKILPRIKSVDARTATNRPASDMR